MITAGDGTDCGQRITGTAIFNDFSFFTVNYPYILKAAAGKLFFRLRPPVFLLYLSQRTAAAVESPDRM
ncbi:MAG: hypothetical protein JXA20_00040 [Spirochaetes bacterium]|nr:hypothetical protein [Spirochaetota bacterium]